MKHGVSLVTALIVGICPMAAYAQTPVSASIRAGVHVETGYTDSTTGVPVPVSQEEFDADDDFLAGAEVFSRPLAATASATVIEPKIADARAEASIVAAIGTNRVDFFKSASNEWRTFQNDIDTVSSPGGGAASGAAQIYFPSYDDFQYSFLLDAPTTVSVAFRTDYQPSANPVRNTDFTAQVYVGDEAFLQNYNAVRDPANGTLELVIRDVVIEPSGFPNEIRIRDWTGSGGVVPGKPQEFGLGLAYETRAVFLFGGSLESDPILPDQVQGNVSVFTDVISGLWYDPLATDGYAFEMLSDSLFTKIDSLPSFLVNPVTVLVGDTLLGQYNAGESVDFSSLGGVKNFRIVGITPTVDGADPLAFPIQLSFSSGIASFSMAPLAVPEPATSGLAFCGALVLIPFVRRRNRA